MSRTQPVPARRPGFTLVELLVVIGIIVVLVAIILPSINRAYANAKRTRLAMDMQTIATAIEAYRQDHGDIPRTSPDGGTAPVFSGAQVLCRALLGPADATVPANAGDGADGLGFRTVPASLGTSKKYGPYLAENAFRIANPNGTLTDIDLPANRAQAVLIDSEDSPIEYFPGIPKANITAPSGSYVAVANYPPTGARPMYDFGDASNQVSSNDLTLNELRRILGDTNANGQIDAGEAPAFTGPFLLLSAGVDGRYGPADPDQPISTKNRCDDVTNFPRTSY